MLLEKFVSWKFEPTPLQLWFRQVEAYKIKSWCKSFNYSESLERRKNEVKAFKNLTVNQYDISKFLEDNAHLLKSLDQVSIYFNILPKNFHYFYQKRNVLRVTVSLLLGGVRSTWIWPSPVPKTYFWVGHVWFGFKTYKWASKSKGKNLILKCLPTD